MQPKRRFCRHCRRRRLAIHFFKNTVKGGPSSYRPECKACTLTARRKPINAEARSSK